jgi:hypothetical protein
MREEHSSFPRFTLFRVLPFPRFALGSSSAIPFPPFRFRHSVSVLPLPHHAWTRMGNVNKLFTERISSFYFTQILLDYCVKLC